jgi:hypothetical protein
MNDSESRERLKNVSELVEDASVRLNRLLIINDARVGPDERRHIEEAADDLRAAIRFLDLLARSIDTGKSG